MGHILLKFFVKQHLTMWLWLYLALSSVWSLCLALPLDDNLESEVSTMPLCPVQLPSGATEEMKAIISELPFELLNPPNMIGHEHLFEGDIAVTMEEWNMLLSETIRQDEEGGSPSERKAINLQRFFWPPDPTTGIPTVHYSFAGSVTRKQEIHEAMSVWESETCVDFHEIDDGNYNRAYVRIINGQGCWSHVGRTGFRGQQLSIGDACYQQGVILHELGHALGLFHEQSRSDRNNYIRVNYTNVRPGKEVNFFKEETDNFGVPYDYKSLMHYGSTAFSKNGRPTIVTLSPAMQILIGQRKYLTFRDISIINHMYNCTGMWKESCNSSANCLNGGYLGKNCSCVCPPGVSGDFCQNSIQSYYPLPVCGGNITEAGAIITTPNYPQKYPAGSGCVWWIRSSDECKRPKISVDDFDLFIRLGNGKCALDRLEIRTDSIYYGDEHCGRDLREGMSVTALGRDLILIFTAKVKLRRGFKFTVDFVEGCPSNVAATCETTQQSAYLHWTSPMYPAVYPNNQKCNLTLAPEEPKMTYVTYTDVNLPRNCHDFITIDSPFGITQRICGRRAGRRLMVGSYHTASFKSDSFMGTQGWKIAFKQMSTRCHKVINLSVQSPRGILTSPSYPRKHRKYAQCEWWLTAPPGRKIRLNFRVLRLATSLYFPNSPWFRKRFYQKHCRRGYLLISTSGDRSYTRADGYAQRICGYRNTGFQITSNENRLSLLFNGGSARTKGMKVIYTLV